MAHYTLYRDQLETVEENENETRQKIMKMMTRGMHLVPKAGSVPVLVRQATVPGRINNDSKVGTPAW